MIKKNFSIEHQGYRLICKFFGIKISVFDDNLLKKSNNEAIKIQNGYNLEPLKNAKQIILFLIPSNTKINGGIMSIFSLCENSRELNPNSFCYISTFPRHDTYYRNEMFINNEDIYRFDQLFLYAKRVENLIIHIPEFFADQFYNSLSKKQIRFLKKIKNLQINIMNQNIELMPEPKELKNLYKLTDNITQTIAHDRYATQEICNKWKMPTHLFSGYIDYSLYKTYFFEEKEKIIVLSPDSNEFKEEIVNKIKKKLPDWKLITVNNMTFIEYMDLISKAYFTITFGEGFDGYFVHQSYVGSIGIAVYNDNFFPSKEWVNLENCFSSYIELKNNIVTFIKDLSKNKERYYQIIDKYNIMIKKLYKKEEFIYNLKRFYKNEYDFIPDKEQL